MFQSRYNPALWLDHFDWNLLEHFITLRRVAINATRFIIANDDRNLWLNVFAEVYRRLNWICHAYYLMDNHYHLLVETPETIYP